VRLLRRSPGGRRDRQHADPGCVGEPEFANASATNADL